MILVPEPWMKYFAVLSICLLLIVIIKNLSSVAKNWKYVITVVPLILVYINSNFKTHPLNVHNTLEALQVIPIYYNFYNFPTYFWILLLFYNILELLLPNSLTGYIVLMVERTVKAAKVYIKFCIKYIKFRIKFLRKKEIYSIQTNIRNSERPILDKDEDWIGSNELAREFYESYINGKFDNQKNTIIILNAINGMGKSSFINLLKNIIIQENNTFKKALHQIEVIQFSVPMLLAECDINNSKDVLSRFLEMLKQELKNTANYDLFKYIVKGYASNKFGVDIKNLSSQRFENFLDEARGQKQYNLLIIEDLDQVASKDELKHIIKFLWHIKALPNMITILPMKADLLWESISDVELSASSCLNNSIHYHKLIDVEYNFTKRIRNKQVEIIWGTGNKLYKKDEELINIEVHPDSLIYEARSDSLETDKLYIDNICIRFNKQKIMINDLPKHDQEKINRFKINSLCSPNSSIKYDELLFLPFSMLNFWQNTTIYPSILHENLFKTIIFNILVDFNISLRETKKIINFFDENYLILRNKNIFDVLVYSIIEIRYKFKLNKFQLSKSEKLTMLDHLKNRILYLDNKNEKMNYNIFPSEIRKLLYYTSDQLIIDKHSSRGLFDYSNNFGCYGSKEGFKFPNNMNGATRFLMLLNSNNRKALSSKLNQLLWMFYHRFLILNNNSEDCILLIPSNTFYRLSCLKFFEDTSNYEQEMSEIEIIHCFMSNSNAISFIIFFIGSYKEITHNNIRNKPLDYINWLAKNISKAIKLLFRDGLTPFNQLFWDNLFNIVIDSGDVENPYIGVFDNLLEYRKENNSFVTTNEQSNKLQCENIWIKIGRDHFEKLEITLRDFKGNLNYIMSL